MCVMRENVKLKVMMHVCIKYSGNIAFWLKTFLVVQAV